MKKVVKKPYLDRNVPGVRVVVGYEDEEDDETDDGDHDDHDPAEEARVGVAAVHAVRLLLSRAKKLCAIIQYS